MELLGVERCPTEVLDHIIDFLHEDKPTLTSCSLVCRNWASSARFHLFYSIRIAGAGPTKLEAFSGLLASASYIGYYVQELHIRAGDGPAKITTATLSIILKALVRIRVLDVRCTYCHFDGLFPPPLLTLRKLVMQFVEVDTPPAKFISILGLCPNLKELDIRKSWWASQISFPEEPKTSVMPYLESLTLGNCRFSSLTSYLQVLRSNLPLSNLTSLDIVCLSPNDVSVIGGLLRDMGSKLLHLRLRMGSLLLQGTSTSLSHQFPPSINPPSHPWSSDPLFESIIFIYIYI